MALVRQSKTVQMKNEETRTCLKLKQNILQLCKLTVVLIKKIKKVMCCYATTTWLKVTQGFLKEENILNNIVN